MDVVFVYYYGGKTNFLLVTYNACKPDKFKLSPHKSTLNIGNEYSIELISAHKVDAELAATSIGGGEACQMYAKLNPISVGKLKQDMTSGQGGLIDLKGSVVLTQIN
jgi:hypothetical protein